MINNKLKNLEIIEFKVKGDERGKLIAVESRVDVSFDIKRVFYIYGTQNDISRGNHSHYKTNQFLICVSGSCKVTLQDAYESKTYQLDRPNKGLLQENMVWGSMHDFSNGCVLLVLADRVYDDSDYIRDYSDFLELARKNENV